MSLRKFGEVLLVVVLALLAGAGNAAAADDEKSTGDEAYEECISRSYDEAATRQLVKDGTVDLEKYVEDGQKFNAQANPEVIEKIKKDHPEEYRRLAEHYEKDQSLGSKGGRTVNSAACNMKKPADTAVKAAGEYWEDPVGKFVQALIEGNAEVLQLTMTFWFDFSTAQTRNVDANIQGVKNIVAGLAAMALICSFIIGGYRIAASRRMGLQDGVEETAGVVVKYIVFSFGVVAAVPGALIATDVLANKIMENFGVTDPNQVVDLAALDESMGGPVILMILAIVSLLGGLMQILALVVRTLILPIVVGLTPLAAASSFSETGRNMLNNLVAYMIAAVAYKPLAALLYAVVMWNASQPAEGDVLTAAVNVLMIALAGFCAPALVRVIAPMTAQAGGGGAAPLAQAAGAGVAGALGAGAMLASGGSSVLAASAAKGAAGASAAGGSPAPSAAGAPVSSTGRAPKAGSSGGSGAAPARDTTPSGSTGSSRASSVASGGSRSAPTASGGSASPAGSGQSSAGGGQPTAAAAMPSGQPGAAARTQANRGFGQRMGAFAAGTSRAATRAATVTERIGAAGLSGTASAMKVGAAAARGAAQGASHTQRVLDDSIGVSGFAGGRHQ
ncbi:hypothetical protein ACLB3B_02165 [Corynebacterium amycolatum]|uniref:hypothetical protein n=1 Tax=Corynebacterium amycolatum TaxID=43765 RepID=UPI00399B2E20